jgi:hypothetical protein
MPDLIVVAGAIVLVGVLLGLLLLIAALRRYRRIELVRGTAYLAGSTVVVLAAIGVVLVAMNLFTYTMLTREQEAAHVSMRQLGERQFLLRLSPNEAPPRQFELRGDEWQIDARVLKWRAVGTLLGFDTVYRFERLSGRYANTAQERSAPRTVHALAADPGMDLWRFTKRYHRYLPLADALYGSAAYVPMADGADYVVSVSTSGLVVRPQNEEARRALGGWK